MRLVNGDLPTICSVCRQPPSAYPEGKVPEYVNMESAYDGPVVDQGPNVPGVYVENIVVCADCVRQSAELLGMENVDRLREHVSALEAHIDQLEAGQKAKDRAISDLSHTVGTLIDTPVKRPPGRPHFQGPDTHEGEIKKLRSARAKAEKAAKASKVAGGANRE